MSIQEKEYESLKKVIIEDINEESEVECEPLVSQSKGHHPSTLFESYNKDKGKNIFTDDEIK